MQENFTKYLPAYLSAASYDRILEELKTFPDNIDKRIYTLSSTENDYLQGDGLASLPVISLPDTRIETIPCIILSNSCDISKDNTRNIQTSVTYAPILKLEKLKISLKTKRHKTESQIHSILEGIRKQKYSNIFYLPVGYNNSDEQYVLLDKICHCPIQELENTSIKSLFRLSNYGFYVLLMKIAIHYTRMQEGVDRN